MRQRFFPVMLLAMLAQPLFAQEAERRALETERRVLEAERRVQEAERRAAAAGAASPSAGATRAQSEPQRQGCESARRTYQSLCSRREMETGAEARECHAAADDVRKHC